jgi:uncharacterized protein
MERSVFFVFLGNHNYLCKIFISKILNMKKVLICLLLCSFMMSAEAQIKTKNEKIIQLLDVMGTTQTMEQAMGNMIGSFKESFKTVPTEFWTEFMKEINLKELQTLIIPVYDKNYTEKDIDQFPAFYSTPIGKKTISSLPTIMQESMAIGQNWGRAVGIKVYEKVKEKGYIKE